MIQKPDSYLSKTVLYGACFMLQKNIKRDIPLTKAPARKTSGSEAASWHRRTLDFGEQGRKGVSPLGSTRYSSPLQICIPPGGLLSRAGCLALWRLAPARSVWYFARTQISLGLGPPKLPATVAGKFLPFPPQSHTSQTQKARNRSW